MTAYIAALRTAYDTLLAHMTTEGGVPMTDELARAIEVVEAHDAEGGRHGACLEARCRAGVHVP